MNKSANSHTSNDGRSPAWLDDHFGVSYATVAHAHAPAPKRHGIRLRPRPGR